MIRYRHAWASIMPQHLHCQWCEQAPPSLPHEKYSSLHYGNIKESMCDDNFIVKQNNENENAIPCNYECQASSKICERPNEQWTHKEKQQKITHDNVRCRHAKTTKFQAMLKCRFCNNLTTPDPWATSTLVCSETVRYSVNILSCRIFSHCSYSFVLSFMAFGWCDSMIRKTPCASAAYNPRQHLHIRPTRHVLGASRQRTLNEWTIVGCRL